MLGIRLTNLVLLIFLVAGCKIIESSPVFQENRVSFQDARKLAGTFADAKGSILRVSTFGSSGDLRFQSINKETQKPIATGNVTLSRIPGTQLFLATIRDLIINLEDNPKKTNAIAVLRFQSFEKFDYFAIKDQSEFSKLIDSISDLRSQEDFIKQYLLQNHKIFSQSDIIFSKISITPKSSPELTSLDGFYFVSAKGGVERFKFRAVSRAGRSQYNVYLESGDYYGVAELHTDTQQLFWIPKGPGHRCNRNGWRDGNFSSVFQITEDGIWKSTGTYSQSKRYNPRACLSWDYLTNPCEKTHCVQYWGPRNKASAYIVKGRSAANALLRRLR